MATNMRCVKPQKSEELTYRKRKLEFKQLILYFLILIYLLSFFLYQITEISAAFEAMLLKGYSLTELQSSR